MYNCSYKNVCSVIIAIMVVTIKSVENTNIAWTNNTDNLLHTYKHYTDRESTYHSQNKVLITHILHTYKYPLIYHGYLKTSYFKKSLWGKLIMG